MSCFFGILVSNAKLAANVVSLSSPSHRTMHSSLALPPKVEFMLGDMLGAVFVLIASDSCPDSGVDPGIVRAESAVDGFVDAAAFCADTSLIVSSMHHVAASSLSVMTN